VFVLTYQDKKFLDDFFLRSLETGAYIMWSV